MKNPKRPTQCTHQIKGILTICKWPKQLVVLNFVNSGITINRMAKVLITLIITASQAVVKTVFCIEENREEGAEKTPSTCSSNQGNQHFSHPVYCDTRMNKI